MTASLIRPRLVGQRVVCAAIAALLAIPCAHAAPETEAMLSEIATALSKGEAMQAQQLATTALAGTGLTDPQRARLLLDRGLAREQQGAHGDAVLDLTQAIGIHALPQADEAMALFERGMALDSQGRLADALGDYDAAVRLSPGSAPALNNRANANRRLGHPEDAKRDYLASIAAGNTQPEYPYYGLGQLAEAAGDIDAARGHYAKAVAANPGYRLAVDRLNALGGPREGAMADNRVVLLHPPGEAPKADLSKSLPAVPPLPEGFAPAPAGPVHPARLASAGHRSALPLRPAITGDVGGGHGGQVQLGAWRQETEASEAWGRAVKRAGGDLAGLAPHIVAVDLPGRGRYYRLRVSADAGAANLCATLTAKGLDCLPVRD